MLVACRLADLSALEAHYADIGARAIPADTALPAALRAFGHHRVAGGSALGLCGLS
jgi:hypothetical protein